MLPELSYSASNVKCVGTLAPSFSTSLENTTNITPDQACYFEIGEFFWENTLPENVNNSTPANTSLQNYANGNNIC